MDACEGEKWFVHDLYFCDQNLFDLCDYFLDFLVEGETQIQMGGREGALSEKWILNL